jgi:hypothetical protein
MLASDDIHLDRCWSTNSPFGSARYFTAKQNVGRVKSSVDDLTMERGTVSMRVAFVLRSAEVQPLFRDLCRRKARSFISDELRRAFLPADSFPPLKKRAKSTLTVTLLLT